MISKTKKAIGYFLYILLGSWLPHYQLGYSWPISKKIRALSGKLMFDYCGKNIDIGRGVKLSKNISLGDNSSIGDHTYINGQVVIGKNVMMAPNCALIASSHNFQKLDIPMNQQGEEHSCIWIDDDVWIGYGAIILKGVHIHKGSIIAAGGCVTKDVEEYSIVGGVPAKCIGKRTKQQFFEIERE